MCLVTLYCVVCASGVSGGGSAASKILMNQCLTFLVVYCPPLSKSDGWIEKDWMVDGEISRRDKWGECDGIKFGKRRGIEQSLSTEWNL